MNNDTPTGAAPPMPRANFLPQRRDERSLLRTPPLPCCGREYLTIYPWAPRGHYWCSCGQHYLVSHKRHSVRRIEGPMKEETL